MPAYLLRLPDTGHLLPWEHVLVSISNHVGFIRHHGLVVDSFPVYLVADVLTQCVIVLAAQILNEHVV